MTDKGRIFVGCGKCAECLQKRRADWTFRLLQELKVSTAANFLTFTYSEEKLPQDQESCKRDFQLFMKRLRKENLKYSKNQIRYYAVMEFGEKDRRPHYHAIIFNLAANSLLKMEDIWSNGIIYNGSVTQASIHYVLKYMLVNQTDTPWKPFSLMSKRPYLGYGYVKNNAYKYHDKQDNLKVTYDDGFTQAMPKIYKQKMFSKIKRQVKGLNALNESDQIEKNLIEKAEKKGIDFQKRMAENRRSKTKQMNKQSKSKTV